MGVVRMSLVNQTLDEALGSGKCRLTEVSESGSVPELFFENLTKDKVLLLDGEELHGAKQNRVLNLTLLIGGELKIKIPVSCVEQGRWNYKSANFSAGETMAYAELRAAKMSGVSASARRGTRSSDQREVWDRISEKSMRMNAQSSTGAAEAIFEKHRATTEEYRKAIQPQAGQLGALFAVNGAIIGLDLFDAEKTFGKVFNKLVTSYAIDAIDVDQEVTDAPPKAIVEQFLKHIAAAKVESFKSLGEGRDIRLESKEVIGAALQDGEQIVHLAAFRTPEAKARGRFRERVI